MSRRWTSLWRTKWSLNRNLSFPRRCQKLPLRGIRVFRIPTEVQGHRKFRSQIILGSVTVIRKKIKTKMSKFKNKRKIRNPWKKRILRKRILANKVSNKNKKRNKSRNKDKEKGKKRLLNKMKKRDKNKVRTKNNCRDKKKKINKDSVS